MGPRRRARRTWWRNCYSDWHSQYGIIKNSNFSITNSGSNQPCKPICYSWVVRHPKTSHEGLLQNTHGIPVYLSGKHSCANNPLKNNSDVWKFSILNVYVCHYWSIRLLAKSSFGPKCATSPRHLPLNIFQKKNPNSSSVAKFCTSFHLVQLISVNVIVVPVDQSGSL